MQKDTVSIAFVRAAVRMLSGEVRDRVLEGAGISSELLEAPVARVSAKVFANLWLAVARELDDEFFGLDSRRMKVGSFALLCHAILHCPDIGSALRRCLWMFAVLLDDVEGRLVVEDEQVIVRIHNRIRDPDSRRFADETLLVMVHGLISWMAGQRISLQKAAFAYPEPEHSDEYRVIFSHSLVFDAEYTEVLFDRRLLTAPTVQNEVNLKRFLATAPQSVFLKYRDEDSWSARLRKRLRDYPETSLPTLDTLAGAFNVAPSTLRRRLEAEGTSYQAIKDALRRDLAIHYLSESTLSNSDIAELLGYQDISAFYRAFKRWTGSQPGEYRAAR